MSSYPLYVLGVLFSQFCAIHYFAYFVSIFSIWETLLENCFLLSVSFHVEHNINFLFSIVAIYARIEIPCALYFHHFSELPWQLLAGGKVVHVCSVTQLRLTLCDPMDREAWWATVPGVTKSRTQLSDWAHMHNFASSKEQSRQFRDVMKSIMYKELPSWHKLQLWKTENWYYAPYEK